MTPQELVKAFTKAVEDRNGDAMATLFTEDGVYHDVFYGEFKGRARVKELVDDWFYRHARDFRWDMLEPVSDGRNLYTPYMFSYISTLPEAKGKRVMFEGVGIMRLKDGLITSYREIANTGPALVDTGFPPERVAKILARQGESVAAQPEAARHRA
jgi:limonene-1,2-epoxide hydrolase